MGTDPPNFGMKEIPRWMAGTRMNPIRMHTPAGVPPPAGAKPKQIAMMPINRAYGSCVFAWSNSDTCEDAADRMVVSLTGEQWSPQTAPPRTAEITVVSSC
mmetsp:Transcript_105997/g.210690  ORF Transcript_105997/g.210690 Transcript_105997/m.210690 type:complete len:101 (-) Transcript_105997:1019-1321(-)